MLVTVTTDATRAVAESPSCATSPLRRAYEIAASTNASDTLYVWTAPQ